MSKFVEVMLSQYSDEIFSPRRVFSHIDLDKIKKGQYTTADPLPETNTIKLELMSFGQYLYAQILNKGIKLSVIEQQLQIPREQIDLILEDEVTPWDLGADLIAKFEMILGLDRMTTKQVIKRHVIPKSLLEKKIPQNMNLAARSAKELSDKEREAEIKESLRRIAITTQDNLRNELLRIL